MADVRLVHAIEQSPERTRCRRPAHRREPRRLHVALALLLPLALAIESAAQTPPTPEMLRARAQERMRQDLAVYSREDFRSLEALYQTANRNLQGPDAKGILQRVVTEYPKSNRAGSATLYLAQLSSGAERESYLKAAIENHGDTFYGDGVQVGAFARALLASFYAAQGKMEPAQVLAGEVEREFPGAIDHNGRPQVEMLRKLQLLP